MLAIDWAQLNTKSVNTKVANTPIRFFPSSSQIILLSRSGYHPKLENTFSPLINNKKLKLIKKKRFFYC